VSDQAARAPRVPPAWFVHTAWRAHRALYRLSGGRFLWATSNRRGWGALHLTTTGRTSGRERSVIVGYIEDGPSLVVLAMNGWQEGQPGWWRNLEGVRTPSFDWRTSNLAGCAHARRQVTIATGCGNAGSRSTRRWTRMRGCGRPKRPSSSSSRPTGPRGIGAMVSAPVRMRRGRTATSLTRLRSSAPAGRPGAHVGRSHPDAVPPVAAATRTRGSGAAAMPRPRPWRRLQCRGLGGRPCGTRCCGSSPCAPSHDASTT
jgi:hypothetical protein